MSNRCYLFTCDADPTRFEVTPRGLCEHVGQVALAQLILLTEGARVIDSLLFEDQLAVLADREAASARLLAFVDKLGDGIVGDPDDLADAVAQMREVLASTPGRYVLLEVAEVLDREDVPELVASLPEVAAQVDRALRGEEDAWLDDLRADWADLVMPWWANALYCSFDAPAVTWSREEVEAMLSPYDQRMAALVGHPFRYRLAPGLGPAHLRAAVGVLRMLAADVESVPDPRVWSCELSVHDGDQLAVAFRDATLFISLTSRGWPSEGPRRRIKDALGIAPPPTRFEYGRGVV